MYPLSRPPALPDRLPLTYVTHTNLIPSRHTFAMDDISSFLKKLLSNLSEENYDHTFSVYRF